CNFLRLYCWALVQIVAHAGPASPGPKYSAAAVSLIACYGIVAALCAFQLHLFVEEPLEVAPAEGSGHHASA
ncbi:MAG: hypothetical protein JW810_14650, partial [Sedimentisphaerales bacterium]|nr:hypothetical protein [Sedimentisphaerales bacterium]